LFSRIPPLIGYKANSRLRAHFRYGCVIIRKGMASACLHRGMSHFFRSAMKGLQQLIPSPMTQLLKRLSRAVWYWLPKTGRLLTTKLLETINTKAVHYPYS